MDIKLIEGHEYLVVYKVDRLAKYPTLGYYIYKGLFRNSHALKFVLEHDQEQAILLYKDEIMEIKPVTPLLNRQSDKDYLNNTPNTPKVGDTWLVLMRGDIILTEGKVISLSNKVVAFSFSYTEGRVCTYRYKLSDVEFVELVPVADAVDTAISELESALYNKRGKVKQKD